MTVQELHAPAKYKLTLEDYLTLDRSGAFEGLRTELIDGEILVMSPQTARHIFIKSELGYRFRRALEKMRSGLFVGIDGSVAISDRSLPEPDIFLTDTIPADGYVQLQSVKLIVEVAISSLELDLDRKQQLYATQEVPEYWVADVNGRLIHQMWMPAGGAYAQRREVAFGEAVEAATVAGLRVETDGL